MTRCTHPCYGATHKQGDCECSRAASRGALLYPIRRLREWACSLDRDEVFFLARLGVAFAVMGFAAWAIGRL